MITGKQFAETAYGYRNSGIPYSELDCQAFVERVLRDCGYKYDWRGSNHMWREAVTDRRDLTAAIADGSLVPGMLLFIVKDDGKEKDRGYHDDMKNAAHVGIYTGMGAGVMHSTTGGVQEGTLSGTRWTHCAKFKPITYEEPAPEPDAVERFKQALIDEFKEVLNEIRY